MSWWQFELKDDQNAPSARECHSINVLGDKLILFGGNDSSNRMDEVYVLDTVSMKWSKLLTEGDKPMRRSAHSSCLVDGRYLYIFGGWDGARELNNLDIFDLVERRWSQPVCHGEPPHPRHFHNTVFLGRRMYIYGGYDGNGWRDDMISLDVDTMTWHKVVSKGPCPGSRASGITVIVDKDKLLVYGGYDGDDFLTDMWLLHTISPETGELEYRWERIPEPKPRSVPARNGNGIVMHKPFWPPARSGHAAEVYDNLVIVMGGRHKNGRFSDVVVFNLDTLTWHEFKPAGASFKPRKTHAVGRVGNRLWLFGGHNGDFWMGDLHMLDLEGIKRSLTTTLSITVPPSTLLHDLAGMVSLDLQVPKYCGLTTSQHAVACLRDDAHGGHAGGHRDVGCGEGACCCTRPSVYGRRNAMASNCFSLPSVPPTGGGGHGFGVGAGRTQGGGDASIGVSGGSGGRRRGGAGTRGRGGSVGDTEEYEDCGAGSTSRPASRNNNAYAHDNDANSESDAESCDGRSGADDDDDGDEEEDEGKPYTLASYEKFFKERFGDRLGSNFLAPVSPHGSFYGLHAAAAANNNSGWASHSAADGAGGDSSFQRADGGVTAAAPVGTGLSAFSSFSASSTHFPMPTFSGSYRPSSAASASSSLKPGASSTAATDADVSMQMGAGGGGNSSTAQADSSFATAASPAVAGLVPSVAGERMPVDGVDGSVEIPAAQHAPSVQQSSRPPSSLAPASSTSTAAGVAPLPSFPPASSFSSALPSAPATAALSALSPSIPMLDPQSGGGLFTDVSIIVENQPIRLHRCILAARCEYFRVMFSASFAEGNKSAISLPDMDIPTFTAIIRYIYTDQLPAEDELDVLCISLLQQSQKLGLKQLARLCQRYLEAGISFDNAPALLDLADTHGARPLRRACMRFLTTNFVSISNEGGLVTLRPDLVQEVNVRRARLMKKMHQEAEEAMAAAAAAEAAGAGGGGAHQGVGGPGGGAAGAPPSGVMPIQAAPPAAHRKGGRRRNGNTSNSRRWMSREAVLASLEASIHPRDLLGAYSIDSASFPAAAGGAALAGPPPALTAAYSSSMSTAGQAVGALGAAMDRRHRIFGRTHNWSDQLLQNHIASLGIATMQIRSPGIPQGMLGSQGLYGAAAAGAGADTSGDQFAIGLGLHAQLQAHHQAMLLRSGASSGAASRASRLSQKRRRDARNNGDGVTGVGASQAGYTGRGASATTGVHVQMQTSSASAVAEAIRVAGPTSAAGALSSSSTSPSFKHKHDASLDSSVSQSDFVSPTGGHVGHTHHHQLHSHTSDGASMDQSAASAAAFELVSEAPSERDHYDEYDEQDEDGEADGSGDLRDSRDADGDADASGDFADASDTGYDESHDEVGAAAGRPRASTKGRGARVGSLDQALDELLSYGEDGGSASSARSKAGSTSSRPNSRPGRERSGAAAAGAGSGLAASPVSPAVQPGDAVDAGTGGGGKGRSGSRSQASGGAAAVASIAASGADLGRHLSKRRRASGDHADAADNAGIAP